MRNREILNKKLKEINDTDELINASNAYLKTEDAVIKLINAIEEKNITSSDEILLEILCIYHGKEIRNKQAL